MRTMTMIERAVAGDLPLSRVRATALERGWSPEMFAAKVAEIKPAARLSRPRVSTPKPAPAKRKAAKPAPRKAAPKRKASRKASR